MSLNLIDSLIIHEFQRGLCIKYATWMNKYAQKAVLATMALLCGLCIRGSFDIEAKAVEMADLCKFCLCKMTKICFLLGGLLGKKVLTNLHKYAKMNNAIGEEVTARVTFLPRAYLRKV